MSRSLNVAFAILCFSATSVSSDEPPPPPTVESSRQSLLEERVQRLDEFRAAQQAGEMGAATAAAERLAGIERKLTSQSTSKESVEDQQKRVDLLGSLADNLQWLSDRYKKLEQFDQVLAMQRERTDILIEIHGPNDYHVTDAKLAATHTQRLKGMGADDRKSLAEADILDDRVVALFQSGEFPEALAVARTVSETRENAWQGASRLRHQSGQPGRLVLLDG